MRTATNVALLTIGGLLAVLGAVVLVVQYRPVLFVHDTEFIGFSLGALAGFGTIAGFRVGRRVRRSDDARILAAAARMGAIVAGVAAAASAIAVVWYRVRDGVGWPRVELVVLVVLVGALAFVAVLVGVACARWWEPARWIVAAGLFLGAVVAMVAVSWGMQNDFSGEQADQCVVRGTVRYCHFGGYQPFVDDWAPVVDAVLGAAPPEVAQRPLLVQQTANAQRSVVATPRPAGAGVAPLLAWSPGDTAPFALAIDVANWATGRVAVPEGDSPLPQIVDGGGRGVVVFWLAAQATQRTRSGFEYYFYDDPCGDAVSGNDYVEVLLPSGLGPEASARYAAALLKDPDAPRKVLEHWAELTRPDRSASDAGRILGIEPGPEKRSGC